MQSPTLDTTSKECGKVADKKKAPWTLFVGAHLSNYVLTLQKLKLSSKQVPSLQILLSFSVEGSQFNKDVNFLLLRGPRFEGGENVKRWLRSVAKLSTII